MVKKPVCLPVFLEDYGQQSCFCSRASTWQFSVAFINTKTCLRLTGHLKKASKLRQRTEQKEQSIRRNQKKTSTEAKCLGGSVG